MRDADRAYPLRRKALRRTLARDRTRRPADHRNAGLRDAGLAYNRTALRDADAGRLSRRTYHALHAAEPDQHPGAPRIYSRGDRVYRTQRTADAFSQADERGGRGNGGERRRPVGARLNLLPPRLARL